MTKSKHPDIRIIKTRQKLRTAFAQMMSTTPYDQITVFDLCDKADVRRATFYKHFGDKNDFFSYIISLIQEDIVRGIAGDKDDVGTTVDYYTQYVQRVIAYINSNSDIINNVLKSNDLPVIMNLILDATYDSLKKELDEDKKKGIILPADVATLSSFLNGGLSWMVVSWVQNRYCSEDEFINQVRKIITKILSN